MSEANPFDPPASSRPRPPAPLPPGKRPLPPKVIGVIGIVMGAFAILGGVWNLISLQVLETDLETYRHLGLDPGVLGLLHLLGILMGGFLLAVAIGLVRYRRWARVGFNAYAGVALASQLAGNAYVLFHLLGSDLVGQSRVIAVSVVVGVVIGSAFSLGYPILGLILLNRRRVIDHLD